MSECYVLLYRNFRIDVIYAQCSLLNHHLAAFSPSLRVGVFLGPETLSPFKRQVMEHAALRLALIERVQIKKNNSSSSKSFILPFVIISRKAG